MNPKAPRHKGVYILPNLFTAASMFAAFMGLIWSAQGDFYKAGIAILVSAVLDALDGRVARLTNTASEFGVQFDSLADLVAFGLAPAFLIYQMALHNFGRLGIAIAFMFAVCCALRLARFNVAAATNEPSNKKFFIGVPAPAAGCSLAIFILFIPDAASFMGETLAFIPNAINKYFNAVSLVLTGIVALLMVSQFRYAAFKEMGFLKAHPFRYLVFAIIIFATVVAQPIPAIFTLLFLYLISGVLYTVIVLPRKGVSLIDIVSDEVDDVIDDVIEDDEDDHYKKDNHDTLNQSDQTPRQ